MRYLVMTPEAGYTGKVAGVAFADGRAAVDSEQHRQALAYFRRKGYRVEEAQPEPEPEQAEELKVPGRGDSKATWVRYVTSDAAGEKRLDEADAQAKSRDELAEHVLGPKEG